MSFEKVMVLNRLFDFYEPLLTDKQREVFKYYYQEDLSYQEIAEILKISRSAVYDNLQRTVSLLESYEAKLGLSTRYQKLFDRLYDLDNPAVNDILKMFEKGGQHE